MKCAVVGIPGCVMDIDPQGNCRVYWEDMPELARMTSHALESLILDESFQITQFGLFGEEAA